MDRNNEGVLGAEEREELECLVELIETLISDSSLGLATVGTQVEMTTRSGLTPKHP